MAFKRYPSHRKKRLGTAWRRPRGWQNKLRLEKKGHGKRVKVGNRTAAEVRDKKSGLLITQVYNLADIEALDPKTHGVVIGKVGMKKRIALLKAVQERKLTLLTGDPAKHIKELEDRFASRKKAAVTREKEKQEKQKELEKKAETDKKQEEKDDSKESLEEAADAADKEKAAKKEKEKVLTKAR